MTAPSLAADREAGVRSPRRFTALQHAMRPNGAAATAGTAMTRPRSAL
jgi:hypothetical protein